MGSLTPGRIAEAMSFAERQRAVGNNFQANIIDDLLAAIAELKNGTAKPVISAAEPGAITTLAATLSRITDGRHSIDDVTRIRSFWALVRQMREAQKSYFRTHSTAWLTTAKELETKVDEFWDAPVKQEVLVL